MKKKVLFFSWVKYDHHSDMLAKNIGCPIYFVRTGPTQSWLMPLRYLNQAWQTWRLLRKEKPTIMLTQLPTTFSALVPALYTWLFGGHFVLSTHSASFLAPRWQRLLPLHKWLSRRALTTIVHNSELKTFLDDWDCHVSVIGYLPGEYPPGEPYGVGEGFNVAVISSFDSDEPTPQVIDAARELADVNFYFTGPCHRAEPELLASAPANCTFTGYVPYEQYIGLMREVDAMIDLTNWDHTILMGAIEAVSLCKPLITSDTTILRKDYPLGAVYVKNDAAGIRAGVEQARQDLPRLQAEMNTLHDQLIAQSQHEFEVLHQQFDEALDVQ